MNILFVDQFSELGGGQQCLLEILTAVRERGWQASLVIPGDGPFAAQARAVGVNVYGIPCCIWKSPRFALDMAAQAGIIRNCARGTDLVFVNGPRVLPGAAAARRGPMLFHCHSLVPPGPARWLARAALRLSHARVMASCRFVAQSLAPDAAVVYNGAVGPGPNYAPRPRGAHWRIGVIGRVSPEKGHIEFLAAARLLTRVGAPCRFFVFGDSLFSPPAYFARVRELARGLPVEFTGWQEDVYEALAGLDLVVVPSSPVEGTTRVILEAYAAGVPVVAFASGGIPEVIADGCTGFIVHTRTPEALAQRIRELLENFDQLRDCAAAGRECWRERFTLERYRRQVLEQIEAAAAGKAPPPSPRHPRPQAEPEGTPTG